MRRPFEKSGLWLVRPDGYVAVATKSRDWLTVLNYLDRYARWPAETPDTSR